MVSPRLITSSLTNLISKGNEEVEANTDGPEYICTFD